MQVTCSAGDSSATAGSTSGAPVVPPSRLPSYGRQLALISEAALNAEDDDELATQNPPQEDCLDSDRTT